jgi:ribosomal protein L29
MMTQSEVAAHIAHNEHRERRIPELKAEIAELKSQAAALVAKIAALKAELAALNLPPPPSFL